MTALEVLDAALAEVAGSERVRRSYMVDLLLDVWLLVPDQVARDEITAAAIRCSPVVGMMAEADAVWLLTCVHAAIRIAQANDGWWDAEVLDS